MRSWLVWYTVLLTLDSYRSPRGALGRYPGQGSAGLGGSGAPWGEGRTGPSAQPPVLGPWEITQRHARVRVHGERGIGTFTTAKVEVILAGRAVDQERDAPVTLYPQ